jgi:hypothetical protein
MTTFVLVHGGFGSPAELAPVIPELEALGHHAIAVDLPSTDPAATLDDYAKRSSGLWPGSTGRLWSSPTRRAARQSRSCPAGPASTAWCTRGHAAPPGLGGDDPALTQPWPGRSLPDVPTTFVLCTEDTILPPPRQHVMAGAIGRGAHRDRLRPCGLHPPAERARGDPGGVGRSTRRRAACWVTRDA